MAVPGRRNGMIDGDEDENGILFVEEGALPEADFEDTPLHLRDLAAAAMHGDVGALRQALGFFWELDFCKGVFVSAYIWAYELI
nr:ankyrin repeat-containing protein [Tanacetum cinerariifolium]